MNEQQWQEMIPFYVAQTLPPEQVRAFEQYAAANGERAAREIDEWRRLAAAVWAEADDVTKTLPPLSQEVYNRLGYQNAQPTRYGTNPPRPDYAPNTTAAPRVRRSSGGVPVTLVAGIVMALVFGAVLLGLGLRPAQEEDLTTQVAINATQEGTPDAAAAGIIIAEESGTPSQDGFITNTPIPGSGILNTPVDQPTATNTVVITAATVFVSPTVTPIPSELYPTEQLPPTVTPAGGGGDPAASTITEEDAPLGGGPYITMTPGLMQDGYHQCFLFNPTDQYINVHRAAGSTDIVGSVAPGAQYRTLIRSTNGWYQIFLQGTSSAVSGWIPPGNAYLTGNCDAALFWVPTATSTPAPTLPPRTPAPTEPAVLEIGPGNVAIVEVPSTTLHVEPIATSEIVATVQQGDRLTPLAATFTNGTMWTRVQFGEFVGWIITAQITTYAEDDAPPENDETP